VRLKQTMKSVNVSSTLVVVVVSTQVTTTTTKYEQKNRRACAKFIIQLSPLPSFFLYPFRKLPKRG